MTLDALPRPGFGKGRSQRFRLPVAAGQSQAPFRETRRADRIGTRAFRRARRRRTQVVFRPGGAASALLYNNRAVRAGMRSRRRRGPRRPRLHPAPVPRRLRPKLPTGGAHETP